ncbi:hypothetical protein THICB3320752 [Thiomonas sp. CB3]|nr:hypothetical protein THICB3320752 [Thiomonas sp. CB3]
MTASLRWLAALFADEAGVPDDARVAAFVLIVSYVALGFWAVVINKQPLDFQNWGIGAGALTAGVGGWFGLRKNN